MKQFLVILILFSSISSFSQENKLIKTSEYVGEKKRRDLFYDKDMNLVKEYYYYMGNNLADNTNLCNKIEYGQNKEIIKFSAYNFEFSGSRHTGLFLEIDFLNGIYKLPLEKLELKSNLKTGSVSCFCARYVLPDFLEPSTIIRGITFCL